MRSEYVFAAVKQIGNRFLLCRMTSVSARRLQVGSKQPSETINQSLLLLATAEIREDITGPESKSAATAEVIPIGIPVGGRVLLQHVSCRSCLLENSSQAFHGVDYICGAAKPVLVTGDWVSGVPFQAFGTEQF